MNKNEYLKLVKKYTPKEEVVKNALVAFISGGLIGVFSTFIYCLFINSNFDDLSSIGATLLIIILLSSILTGLNIFDNLVEKFKCGIIIPISGFAHSMTSEAIDNKYDGLITGIGSTIFKLAGSVLLYGVVSAFILTIIKVIING